MDYQTLWRLSVARYVALWLVSGWIKLGIEGELFLRQASLPSQMP
jgi:hypothetical protein